MLRYIKLLQNDFVLEQDDFVLVYVFWNCVWGSQVDVSPSFEMQSR